MTRHISYKFSWTLTLAATALALGGCGDDDLVDDDVLDSTLVDVTLDEFKVTLSPKSAPEGAIDFMVENTGALSHEFVVIKTDLGPADLPRVPDAGVDEDSDDLEVIDELELVAPGKTKQLTLDLDAGKYVLICNIVKEVDGVLVSHYHEGMTVGFTVN